MRIGVDAFNLAADRRGMGRLVRHALDRLGSLGVDVVHIVRSAQPGALTPRDLARAQLDGVWYPWNAMRFAPHAPAIVTINDPFAFTYPHRNLIARWREQAPIRRAIHRADRIFTISQWGADELHRLFGVPRARLHVVLPSVDTFWHPVQTAPAQPYMLFVGGPEPRKNAALLFAAYDAAFAHEGGPELVVAGTLSASDEARFAGMRTRRRRITPSDEELRELYCGALAVAVPSLAEGFGLPVVEAMACGAPVVASNATALPEAAGGAALLVTPGDVEAWASALRAVAQSAELRDDLRTRGLERVRRLDPDASAIALAGSFRRLREAAR